MDDPKDKNIPEDDDFDFDDDLDFGEFEELDIEGEDISEDDFEDLPADTGQVTPPPAQPLDVDPPADPVPVDEVPEAVAPTPEETHPADEEFEDAGLEGDDFLEGDSEDFSEETSGGTDAGRKKIFILAAAVLGFLAIAVFSLSSTFKSDGQKGTGMPAEMAQDTTPKRPRLDVSEEPSDIEITELSPDALPPMPAPINTAPEITDPMAEMSDEPAESAEGALTPMPEMPVAENIPQAETTENISENLDFLDDDMPAGKPVEDMFSEVVQAEEPVEEAMPSEEVVIQEPPQLDVVEPEPIVEAEIAPPQTMGSDLEAEIEAKFAKTEERIDALEQKFDRSMGSLEQKMTTIIEQNKQIQAQKPPVQAKIAKEKPKNDEEVASKPAKKAVSSKKSAKMPAKASSSGPVKWELRSAQPGQALIKNPETGDFQVVEVGDQVQSIGRVSFIGLKDGRWVVEGPQGQISQ